MPIGVHGRNAKKRITEKFFKTMDWLQALVLGIVQGLTEYLPVSSSGHLAIGSHIFGIEGEENLAFTVLVHVATVCSTLVVLWKEIDWILKGLFKFEMNAETKYFLNIVVSMIPIGIVGVFFKNAVEEVFGSGLLIVGCMLLLTATLLIFSYFAKPRQREHISMKDAFIIGLAQACAVMPGLSRSGSTIATGLMLGNKKESLAQFSFLMVIPPILGEALLDVLKMVKGDDAFGDISALPLVVGFVAAFVSGCVACKWMINIVKKGKLVWFGVYCAIAGAVTIICSLL
jgi:undecaprenyl-diphosphatase